MRLNTNSIPIRSSEEIGGIRAAGRIAARLRRELGKRVAPGVTTRDLDRFAESYMKQNGAEPAQKGYNGYPAAICAAVNDVVCHGIPDDRPLQEGDLVTLDYVVSLNGWMADTAWTYAVGAAKPKARLLRTAAFQAMARGIEQARPGRRIGDIAAAVGRVASERGFGVISHFGGHGIGREIHEPPRVSFVGRAGSGVRLQEGMVITIEPMLTEGAPDIYIAEDGWTVHTQQGGWSAQFEHTVAVTAAGPVVLTRT